MLAALAPLLLASSPLHASVAQPHLSDDCEDIRRLDLSPPVLSPPRICVSPGILTGVIFDHPVTVELEEEVRFVEVTRGRMGIGFIPPRDMSPGEQLRLTVLVLIGETRQSLTLALVAHPGQGTHQVEINYTERTWQSLSDALSQALLTSRRLGEENAALRAEEARARAQHARPEGLCGAYTGGQLSLQGITRHPLDVPREAAGGLQADWAASYRGISHVAVEVQLSNQTQQPWSLEDATLVSERGELRRAIRFRQAEVLLPGMGITVFVEFDATGFTPGPATLTLSDAGDQTLSIPNVVFP